MAERKRLVPTADQLQRYQRMEEWNAAPFDSLRQAVQQTGLIPQLHDGFAQRGKAVGFMVFEAREISTVFMPTRTLYVLPTAPGLVDDAQLNYPFPGLEVSEFISPDGRTVELRVGLDAGHIEEKLAQRAAMIVDKEGDVRENPPDWWDYPYPAIDMTRDYDLSEEVRRSRKDLGAYVSAYIWYGYEQGIPFENERISGGKGVERFWEMQASSIAAAMAKLKY